MNEHSHHKNPNLAMVLPDNDLPSYCKFDESQWSKLPSTSKAFVQALDLPKVHPRCLGDFDESGGDFPIPDAEMNPDYFYEKSSGMIGYLTTIFYQIAPPLLAMGELWLRLFACLIAPLVATYLVSTVLLGTEDSSISNKISKCKDERRKTFIAILGMAACMVLFTDTMYVQEYGRWNGGVLLCTTTMLAMKMAARFSFYRRKLIGSLVIMLLLVGHLFQKSGGSGIYEDPGLDLTTLKEGLYHSSDNALMSRVAEIWPKESRTYDPQRASPLPTGDARTGIPFLVNKSSYQEYHRLWVKSLVDDEAVAIDIAFPTEGHSVTKPVYFVLHGLNGGSNEEYVREFVVRRVKEGHTCIVMIARGLMDTPVFGWDVFHGARVTDVHASAKAVQKAISGNQVLAGVGYSMGAIILSNYVARYGDSVHLDAAIAVSGGLDMRENLNFWRSMRLWQPMLAQSLKEDFIIEKFEGRFRQRLTKEQHLSLMRAASVSDIDIHGIVTYFGFDDLLHYYSEMSAMGDTTAFQFKQNEMTDSIAHDVGRIANVSIPFCVLHALGKWTTTSTQNGVFGITNDSLVSQILFLRR